MNKKRKLTDSSRKVVQPIPLDSSGRPIFPIVLGGLTVYSLGEVSVALLPSLTRSGLSVTKVSSTIAVFAPSDHHGQDAVPR